MKMKKLLPLLAVATLSMSTAQAQLQPHYHEVDGKMIRCYANQKMEEAANADPTLVQKRALINSRIEKYIAKNADRADSPLRSGSVLTIPVVVHVVYRTAAGNLSAARVQEQIDRLNLDYRRQNTDASQTPSEFSSIVADCEIEFCLATRDPQGNPTTGIVYVQTSQSDIGMSNNYYSTAAGGSTAWNSSQYLNIWVCEVGGGVLGYAYLPGSAPASYDGVVIDYHYFGSTGASAPYNMGRTATHEVGHWLNLQHIWGDSGGCSPDDGVSDTPLQDSEYGGCPSHPQNTCGSNDMFMNYMDYVNDACMNSFTQGQRTRMRSAIQSSRPGLLTSQGCISSSLDAGISQIISPVGGVCATTFAPQVVIKNYGSSALTSATINYRVDGGTASTQSWTGNLSTNQSQTVTLGNITVSNGAHTFEAWTSSPNNGTDGDPNNDDSQSSFTANASGQALPFFEGFEAVTFPPNGWSANNPDNSVTWERTTDAAKTGIASMFMDNWDYPEYGEVDEVTLPALNCNTGGTITMTFDVAYSLYTPSGYSDTLRVLVSDDCGYTWSTVYEKYDNNLSTTGAITTVEFVPTSNQWRNESINLSNYNNASGLLIKFQHVADYENNLHVDNINISSTGVSGVAQVQQEPSLAVYPNPTTGLLNIDVKLPTAEDIEIVLFNALGQSISRVRDSGVVQGGYQMDMSSLPAGFYQVQVVSGAKTLSARVVRQ